MSKSLLKRYIHVLLESEDDARVPNQLVSKKSSDKKDEDAGEEAPDVKEFSGAGAIAGFSAPLGLGASDLTYKRPKRKR